MPSSAMGGPMLALLALGNLSLSAMPDHAGIGGRTITVGICGAPGSIEIPLDGSPPRQKNDCATACHALCNRKEAAECEED